MKITYKGDYALKAVLDLAMHYDGASVVTIHDLARRADVPVKFLEQVLLDLKKGGFVESRRGRVGGYLLTRMPSQIKVGEVVRFIDGPIEPIGCADKQYQGCSDIYKCVFRKIWQEVTLNISNIIDNINFEDLAKQVEVSKEALAYSI